MFYQINKNLLEEILDNFQDSVYRKEYDKINYNIWRDLKTWTDAYNDEIRNIAISPLSDSCTGSVKGYYITAEICGEERNYYFPIDDESLGTYIRKNYEDFLHEQFLSKNCITSANIGSFIEGCRFTNNTAVSNVNALEEAIDTKVSKSDFEQVVASLYAEIHDAQFYNRSDIEAIVDDSLAEFPTFADLDKKIYYTQTSMDNMLSNRINSIEVDTNDLRYELQKAINLINELEYRIKLIDGKADIYFRDSVDTLGERISALENKNKEKEMKRSNNNMKGFNFDFGSCAGNSNIRMSMYGLAVQNAMGSWVSYDPKAKQIVDVDIMNFDNCGQYLFKMPVAITDIKVGDIVIHNRKAMFITEITDENKIVAIDPHAGEEKIIVPTTSPFGFNFVTKIISMFDAMTGVSPTPAAPFGNMLPFLMMESDGDIDPMMMVLMMNGGQMDFSNPMLMYMMCKNEGKMSDMLPFMLMMPQAQHKCNCGNH